MNKFIDLYKEHKNNTEEYSNLGWDIYKNILTKSYTKILKEHSIYDFHDYVFNGTDFLNQVDNYPWVYERNIDELKRIILELSFSSISHDQISTVSSAGFRVSFHPKKSLKIIFKEVDRHSPTLFSVYVDTKILRLKKLERILEDEN